VSTFERNEYQWRETYFVLFDVVRRPKLLQVQRMLKKLNARFEIVDPVADDDGRLESLTVVAPDDYAALDISYLAGEEVVEQGAELLKELKKTDLDAAERAKLARIPQLQAKFDLLHFERMADGGMPDEEDPDEMLDPSALLIVLDALVDLTKGVGVDPQSGTIV
jgi:hypothetical protein